MFVLLFCKPKSILAEVRPWWTTPIAPFRIADNLYYVGGEDLSSYLVVTPKGNILINANFAGSPSLIRASVEMLGFHWSDSALRCPHQRFVQNLLRLGGWMSLRKAAVRPVESARGKRIGMKRSFSAQTPSRTRDSSQRQLPTDHDYATSTREYQSDQSSLKSAPTAAAPVLDKRKKQRQRQQQKQPHGFAAIERVTPYQRFRAR